MRPRLLAAAGLALLATPALADYRVCVRLIDPNSTYLVNVEVGGTGVWTPLTVQGGNPACFSTNVFGVVRARHNAAPIQVCGIVASGNTADMHFRAGVQAYVDNKQNAVQVTSCVPA